jgi:predicted kinase
MSQNARIFTLMHEQIQHALGQGTHVVADATHTNQGRLNAYLSRIIRLFPGLTVRVIAFPCDPALARARIDQDLTRGVDRANVPDAALEAQAVQATATLDWLDRTFAQEA